MQQRLASGMRQLAGTRRFVPTVLWQREELGFRNGKVPVG